MEQLSGLDAAFLYLETPEQPLHIVLCAVLDPSEAPEPLTRDRLLRQVASHLHDLPVFTRRLVEVPLRINRPYWAHDPDIDLEPHVLAHTLPAPGGDAQLEEFAAELAETPLDRELPLWQLWMVDGLSGGRVAVLAKVHHSMLDGVAGVEQLVALFDLERQPQPAGEPTIRPADEIPSDRALAADAAIERVRDLAQSLPVLGRTARTAWELTQARRQPEVPAGGFPLTGPSTRLNGEITHHRAVAFGRVAMDDVTTIRKAVTDATINDVLLAGCAGGIRRYLLEHDHDISAPLVVACPVNVRRDEHGLVPNNRVSAMFVDIPIDEPDPARRLTRACEAAGGAKADHARIGDDLLADLADLADPNGLRLGSRLLSSGGLPGRLPPLINLIFSNVPGPPIPLFLAGSRLDNVYPIGAVLNSVGLNITVMSYCDAIDFGFAAASSLVDDLPVLRDHVVEAFTELRAAKT
jgi:WS/DGAT/MGAT family acyltransferase